MPAKSLAMRFQSVAFGSHRCRSERMDDRPREELDSPAPLPTSSSDSDRTLRRPCRCLEKCQLAIYPSHRWMRQKHHMLKLRSNLQRCREGRSVRSMCMGKRKRRPNRPYRHLSHLQCDFPPRCSIKCRTFAVHRFGSIRYHSPCNTVPIAWSRRSRSRQSPFRSHPPTSGRHRMHSARHGARSLANLPTNRTIRIQRHRRVKCHHCRAVCRSTAVERPCLLRKVRESLLFLLQWKAED